MQITKLKNVLVLPVILTIYCLTTFADDSARPGSNLNANGRISGGSALDMLNAKVPITPPGSNGEDIEKGSLICTDNDGNAFKQNSPGYSRCLERNQQGDGSKRSNGINTKPVVPHVGTSN